MVAKVKHLWFSIEWYYKMIASVFVIVVGAAIAIVISNNSAISAHNVKIDDHEKRIVVIEKCKEEVLTKKDFKDYMETQSKIYTLQLELVKQAKEINKNL
jgi:hypothetical protein